MVVRFYKLKPIFAFAPVASKNIACYKSGQNWLKIIILQPWSKSAKKTVNLNDSLAVIFIIFIGYNYINKDEDLKCYLVSV